MTITKIKPGVVQEFDGQMWSVRFGPGVTDIYWLRPRDFIDITPEPDLEIVLFYESNRSSGLWKAMKGPDNAA